MSALSKLSQGTYMVPRTAESTTLGLQHVPPPLQFKVYFHSIADL